MIAIKNVVEKISNGFNELFLKRQVNASARRTNFSKRKAKKLDGLSFLIAMTLGRFKNANNSLGSIIQSTELSISNSGLHQRFNQNAVDFLQDQLEQVLKIVSSIGSRLRITLSKQFKRVLVIDSSGWEIHEKLQGSFKGSGGNASVACIKLQLVFDLLSSAITHFNITPGNVPDQKYTNNIPLLLKKKT